MAPLGPGAPCRTPLGASDGTALSRVADLLGLARAARPAGPCQGVELEARRRPGLQSGVAGWQGTAPWLARDLLHPSLEEEKKKHKKKRLVQSPNSYFMDVKCPGCYKITTVFSHAQTVVLCVGCSTVLCQPTGGKARLTEGCSFRRKQH
ncbi:ribosomal protein eS27-like isoform X1 [Odocoileus virginianus]|uniref:40S ribosomal protein S27 n=1 Tax=Odocoileus virginianus TaxID=9874 RepID=A0ABM4IBR9_ODOVR